MGKMTHDPTARYLDLLKQVLTRALFETETHAYEPAKDAPERPLWEVLREYSPKGTALVRRRAYDPAKRAEGRDWPADAETMVGLRRLDNVQHCVECVITDGVPGDLLEAGAWRGGASILMRAVLAAHEVTDRRVWVADSFEGLPPPDLERYPADAGDRHWTRAELAVSIDDVRRNFARYGLLDGQVRFLEGWFEDTLPSAPVEQLAVLRADGDMYGSTMDILRSLEPRVAPGGFVIIDDYGAIEQCRQAVDDYRAEAGITEEIQTVDWTGVYWRKSGGEPRSPVTPVSTAGRAVAAVSSEPRRRSSVFSVREDGRSRDLDVYSDEGFAAAADLYRRAVWHQQLFKDTRWFGASVLQLPEDLVALQEVIADVRPDVVIETGVAHGGSVVYYASLLELLGSGRVIGIDIGLSERAHETVAASGLGERITLLEGSSTNEAILGKVRAAISGDERVLVVLDADHSYQHVAAELERYAPLVTPGSYIVVTDGVMEVLDDAPKGRAAWRDDNPARAAREFVAAHADFVHDPRPERFGATFFPDGYLRRLHPGGQDD